MPKVSVILTSFNHATYLCEAIDSALNQTFADFELIIWDDASSDNSWEIIQGYQDPRVRAFRNDRQRRGIYGINKAISEIAEGEYIAIHHSDDVWELEKLATQVAFLDSRADIGAVFTNASAIDEDGDPFEDESHFYFKIFDQPNRSRHDWLRHFFEKGNALCHPSVLIRKKCYQDCGLYRYGLAQLGDFDMWVRLTLQYEIHVLPEKLIRFRIRDNDANTSGNRPETRSRGLYEYSLVLNHYLRLNTADDVVKIFPEAQQYCGGENPNLRYALAMTMLEVQPFHFVIQFALNILFDLLNDPNQMEGKGLDATDFIKITGESDPLCVRYAEAIAERDGQIASLNEAAAERDGQIANLSEAVAERDRRIDRIFSSASWRLTRPLRGVKRLAQGNMSGVERPLRALWRRLPLSVARKTGIKTTLRRHLPAAERRFGASPEVAGVLAAAPTGQNATAYQQEYQQRFGVAFNQLSQDFVPLAGDHVDPDRTEVKVIAFYLPQFHPIPENDKNWGRGFTEWTNVSKAVPQFVGHYQPRLPGELGFYDLRLKAIQKRQIELARQYGIHGFCYHHYWFDGKRVLEKPFQQVLDDPTLDLPFCLCWANENWTKRWDGSDEDIIFAQNHSPEDDLRFFEDILPALKDPRYIRIDGRPLLIVYRPGLLPDAAATARRWRHAAAEAGLPGLYIASAATFGFEDYEGIGYDGLVQFPPHNIAAPEITARQTLLNRDFAGHVYDYDAFRQNAVSRLNGKRHMFPCVMMGWDNEARKPGRGHIFAGCTPARYKNWLSQSFDFVLANNAKTERLVFVNAWNEWAEGTYLEPDRRYGYAYLHATATLLRDYYDRTGVDERIRASNALFRKRHESALVAHWYYFDLFDDLKSQLARTDALDVFMTVPEHISSEQIDAITSSLGNVYLIPVKNRGRDILPFLTALPVIESYGYRYLLKVHSKKSPQRSDGARLRQNALGELLDPEKIDRVVALFDSDATAGLIGPPGTLLSLTNGDYVVNNRNHVKTCLSRLGFADAPLNFDFIAGSMFWARVDALQKLRELALTEDDFEEELGQLDGTLAHAIERLFGYLASRVGYRTLTLDQVPAGRVADSEFPFAEAKECDSVKA
ncbi:MAG: glycoside hydrolase family 99-like domain-containing protein [Pseudomonadota bacterium]